jgi:hypothetical protein
VPRAASIRLFQSFAERSESRIGVSNNGVEKVKRILDSSANFLRSVIVVLSLHRELECAGLFYAA